MIDTMPNFAGRLLASSDEPLWVKLIPVAIFAVLWVVAAISNVLKGSPKIPPAPIVPLRVTQQSNRSPQRAKARSKPPPLPQKAKSQPQAKSKKRGGRGVVMPAQADRAQVSRRVLENLESVKSPAGQVPAGGGPAGGVPGGIDAAQIRRWLTPAVMRQQYILTEVFDPPPALRE